MCELVILAVIGLGVFGTVCGGFARVIKGMEDYAKRSNSK